MQEQPVQTIRKVALDLASISTALAPTTTSNEVSLAEDNGFWITGPLPIPPIYNSKQY